MDYTSPEGSEVDSGRRVENARVAEIILGCNCAGCSHTRLMINEYLSVGEATLFHTGDLSIVGVWRIIMEHTCLH